ncbi:hypothetical protein F441_21028 [Phytophthora nicotianae CJ01A1]|uniref:Aromatic amino acid beta-eliminating lyase/threonine aldolase domain-containing protein n=1 Tax=Phytophthora nicotianae CJ01A1 TaxID=1317063 RepID=W2VUC7_PHYNI|nr:hypothetical protein F441_21028 [Phytophthora nicotianae CJ01A1]
MGVSLHTVPNQPNRILNIKDIHNVICDNDVHYFRTRLVEIEKTQNSHDGRVLPMPCILDVEQFCHERNLLLHGDGARLVNTSVTSGIPMDDLVPRSRSSLCGGMLQGGITASTGLYALENQFDHLVEDHTNAQAVAHDIFIIPGIEINPDTVDTNIISSRRPPTPCWTR